MSTLLKRKSFCFFVFCAVALVFAGCKTAPPVLPPVHPAAALPQGMDAYFYLSAPENKDILSHFVDDGRGGRYFLDNTHALYGALGTSGGAGFIIAAQGDYSVGLVEFGIRRDKTWEEVTIAVAGGKARYFRNTETGMEIAIPAPHLILTGSGIAGRLEYLHAGQAVLPIDEEILVSWEWHAAGFYLSRLDDRGLPPLIPPNMPISAKDIVVIADLLESGETNVAGRVTLESPEMAAAASFLLRMYFAGVMGSQGMSLSEIRTALRIAAEEDRLVFSGIRFPREMVVQMLLDLLAEQ